MHEIARSCGQTWKNPGFPITSQQGHTTPSHPIQLHCGESVLDYVNGSGDGGMGGHLCLAAD